MRLLLISDIHANLEALDAVLDAAPSYDLIANLGDVVGYNASPNEVIERVQLLGGMLVRGNHDRACSGLMDLTEFNPVAAISAHWTQNTLKPEYLRWLRALPVGPLRTDDVHDVEFVHGAPADEDEYLLNVRDAIENFALPMLPGKVFFGHTHLQGGFVRERGMVRHIAPAYENADEAVKFEMPLQEGMRYLINPGSVGQPRDGDWRAAFALYETSNGEPGRVTYHRVPYDIKQTQQRILSAGLPQRLAMRLTAGR